MTEVTLVYRETMGPWNYTAAIITFGCFFVIVHLASEWAFTKIKRALWKQAPGYSSESADNSQERSEIKRLRRNLEIANSSYFKRRPVLNYEEQCVYSVLDGALRETKDVEAFFVFPQISVGAFAECGPSWRWRSIASCRPDFVITTYSYEPVICVEYDGEGRKVRDPEECELSDQIKNIAMRKLGVTLIRIRSGQEPDEYKPIVVGALRDFLARTRERRAAVQR